jgi:hypothetical protein
MRPYGDFPDVGQSTNFGMTMKQVNSLLDVVRSIATEVAAKHAVDVDIAA